MKKKIKNIGIEGVKPPQKECQDKHCPFHGDVVVRGRIFIGKVVSPKFHKTVKVEWERAKFLKKYERYMKARTSVKVHSPDCIDIDVGSVVKIAECRPISKTKNFVVIEKLGG
ncbi:MAG: 30S ribosomal protein S17 [Candidatus Woesearchaeota archaeon]